MQCKVLNFNKLLTNTTLLKLVIFTIKKYELDAI
jgi:hypothetical protein